MADTPLIAAWSWLLRTSWQAAVLVAIVAVVHVLLGRWLAPRWRYALWMLVVVRLLMPATPGSPWSIFNLRPPAADRVAVAPQAPVAPVAPLPSDEKTTVTIVRTFPGAVESVQAHAAEIAKPASGEFPWLRALMGLWIAGVVIVFARFVVGYVMLARRLRRAPVASNAAARLLDECRREMGVRSNVRLVTTDAVAGPALFGFLRAKLLIPQGLLSELSTDELRFVFLHELAHVRRRDALAAGLLAAAHALHWFNPLAWLALARCRAERELACDGLVLSVTGAASRHAYGRTMLKLAEMMCASTTRRAAPACAIGMLHNRSQLRRRIGMVMSFTGGGARRRWASLAPLALLLVVASCAMTDKPKDAPPAQPVATRTVDELTADARKLVSEKRYDDALVAIDKIRELDPANAYANGIRPLVYDKSTLKKQRELDEANARQLNIDREQKIPVVEADGIPASVAAMRALLDKRLPEVRFEQTGFADVVDFLRDVTGANIFVDWNTLAAAGVRHDAPVTARLHNVRFGKALDTILADVGGGKVELGRDADGDVITISTRRELRRNTMTRVYDIRDLITVIPDYEPPAAVGAATQPASRPAPMRDQLAAEIVQLIKETVSPDDWTGPQPSSIRELAGQLIVTAPPDTHDQLKALLDQLRETRALQATVETRFITLDLDMLPPALRDKLRQSFGKPGSGNAVFLSDDDTSAILKETQQQKHSTILTAPRVTLFNGQRAYVQVATERAYVSGFSVVKNEKGETRYEPFASTVSSGVLLDVQATASADRKFVTCTLKPRLTQLEAMDTAPWDGAPAGTNDLLVQVPRLLAQELQTTVSIPDGGTLLVGGFVQSTSAETTQPASQPRDVSLTEVKTTVRVPDGGTLLLDANPTSQPATRAVSDVYMLVKPTLIIQREVDSKSGR